MKAQLIEEKYSEVCGVDAKSFLGKIREMIQILLDGSVDYEFRTTVVPTLHQMEDIEKICQAIKGCKKYALQNFKSEVETLNPEYQNLKPFSQVQMEDFLQVAKRIVPNTIVRG